MLIFSIVNPFSFCDSTELKINENRTDNIVVLSIDNTTILIDKQQLGELGSLFLALAGEFDFDSVGELLDGYEIPVGPLVENLTKLRAELAAWV